MLIKMGRLGAELAHPSNIILTLHFLEFLEKGAIFFSSFSFLSLSRELREIGNGVANSSFFGKKGGSNLKIEFEKSNIGADGSRRFRIEAGRESSFGEGWDFDSCVREKELVGCGGGGLDGEIGGIGK